MWRIGSAREQYAYHGVMATLYVLCLEDACWYVGTTCDFPARVRSHQEGNGAAWTRKHKVVRVHGQRSIRDAGPHIRFMEDMVVKKLMLVHGVQKVRGGTYSSVILSAGQRESLVTEIRHASNQCLRCGSGDHYVARCGSSCYRDPAPARILSPGTVDREDPAPQVGPAVPEPAAQAVVVVPAPPAAATWPPQQALLRLWKVPPNRRGPPSADAILTISAHKTPKVLYIQQRVLGVSGMTVAQALKTNVSGGYGKGIRKYRLRDMRYDVTRGYLCVR